MAWSRKWFTGLVVLSFPMAAPSIVCAQQGAPPAHTADRTVFTARVVRRTDLVPIVGADVWIVFLDRHATTDSAGGFRFIGVPAGAQLIQVRHVGYIVQRDTITLVAREVSARTYSLLDQVTQLDTVRASAGKQKYLSPSLNAFEERRLSGEGGYFISDSTIRQNENTTLANLASSRLPGLQALYSDK